MEKHLTQRTSLLNKVERLPANYLRFMQEQILSHRALLKEHNKAYTSLKMLLASDLKQCPISSINSYLLEITNTIHKASTLNESLLNALRELLYFKVLKKPLINH